MIRRLSPHALAVSTIALAFYLLMLSSVLRHLDPVTGDEPFYIMTAISLLRDGDLDESNNYANRDYEEFYPADPLPPDWAGWPSFPRTLPPHPAISERDGLYSKHALGLALLISIPYEIAGRSGASLLVTLFATLLAGQMYLLGRETGATRQVALLVSLGLAVTLPIAPYASLIFPEIPAALLVVYAIRRLSYQENATWQWTLTGLSVGFLPWLHQRFAVMSIVFTLVVAGYVWRTRSRSAALALGIITTGGLGLIGYNYWLYGQPTQNVEDHAGFHGLNGTLNGAAGLLLDAQWGLLLAAPVAILALAAFGPWLRSQRQRALLTLCSVTPYLLVVAAYQVWWGEWGPPARYLVPIVPLLAAPLAAWLSNASLLQRLAASGMWTIGFILTMVGYTNPQRFYHHPDGINKLYVIVGEWLGVDLASWLAAFQPHALDPVRDRIIWALGAGILLVVAAVWITIGSRNRDRAPEV